MVRKEKLPPGLQNRNSVYYSNIKHKGRWIRRRLSTNRATAEKMLRELRVRADRGEFGWKDNHASWKTLRARYSKYIQQTLRRPSENESDLDCFEAFISEDYSQTIKKVSDVTADRTIAFREWKLRQPVGVNGKTVCPRTVNKIVGTVKTFLNWAASDDWRLIRKNPIVNLKPLSHDEPVKVRRALTVEEVESVFELSPSYLVPVWRVIMTTGLRREEVCGLLVSDVDLDRRFIRIRASRSKTHKARDIYIECDTSLSLLRKQVLSASQRQPVEGLTPKLTDQQRRNFTRSHVFVTTANTPIKHNLLRSFYSICKRAGIEDARPGGKVDVHSLRATFISLAIEYGASPKAVQKMVGHATLEMTMNVYAKATDQSMREAVAVLPYAKSSGSIRANPKIEKVPEHKGNTTARNGQKLLQNKGGTTRA